jgi:pyridoxal phosphate enzyme (YggS family)
VFGENRVQEAASKMDRLADLPIEWHLIGHLQSNKAKRAAASFACIQSVDSLDLIDRLDRAAADSDRRPRILIQVDLAHENTKHGADEDAVTPLAVAAAQARSLDLRGLMIVPPNPVRPEDSRPWFRRLRALRDRLVASGLPPACMAELSMGMSHDFEIAIEEGATIVRVGTAIFGDRPSV